MKDNNADKVDKPRAGVCYIEAYDSGPYSCSDGNSTVVFHTNKYCAQANEDYQTKKWCGIYIGEVKPVKVPTPEHGYKYRRISYESFEDYYIQNYWSLQKDYFEEGECYVHEYAKFYSFIKCKDKDFIEIVVNYEVTSIEVTLSNERKPKKYKFDVTRWKPIPEEIFKQAYQLTLELLYDAEAALREWPSYWDQIRRLVVSEEPIKGITINASAYFDEMTRTIKNRKRKIEKKLIETDGTTEERAGLRGELKGLDYCLKIILANR